MLNKVKARKGALIGVVLLWAFLSDALANQLQDVSFSALPGNRVEIVLTTSEPVGEPESFTTDNPARIAIDLANTTSALAQKVTPVAIGMARSVTAIEAGDRTRVVINLLEQVTHEIRSEGNQLYVSLGSGGGAGTFNTRPPEAATAAAPSTSSWSRTPRPCAGSRDGCSPARGTGSPKRKAAKPLSSSSRRPTASSTSSSPTS